MKTSPRDRRYDLTKQKILDTARTILLAEGVGAISMRTLAEKVDYSPAALYKYFANKEELIEALRQEAWQLMATYEPDPVPPSMVSMPELFVRMGRNYIRFASQYPEYYQLIMSTTETGPNNLEEFKQNPNFIGILQFVETAISSGEFELPEGYTPTHLAMLSWFVVHSISLLNLTMMSKCQEEFKVLSLEILDLVKVFFVAK